MWPNRFTDASRPMERNTTFHEMVWHPHKNGHLADGQWQATKVRACIPAVTPARHLHLAPGKERRQRMPPGRHRLPVQDPILVQLDLMHASRCLANTFAANIDWMHHKRDCLKYKTGSEKPQ